MPMQERDNVAVLSLEKSCLEGLPWASVWGPGFPKCYKIILRHEIFEKNYMPF